MAIYITNLLNTGEELSEHEQQDVSRLADMAKKYSKVFLFLQLCDIYSLSFDQNPFWQTAQSAVGIPEAKGD